jgi:carbon starvation protein
MHPLLIALLAGVGFIIAYHTYGRWLGGKIFRLSANAVCPSRKLADGNDYVETDKGVLFGHHFASIAGTGPIVGPAIAVTWGWFPAMLWVFFGSIFIGAVHDLGALVVSLRNNGQTVGDIAGRVINRRVRLLFLLVLFLALTIVLAIFGLVIASVFRMFPSAIVPCLIQVPIAVGIGTWLHRQGRSLRLPSILALAVMYLTVIYGDVGLLGGLNAAMAEWSSITWVLVLLAYSYVASVLPVWVLLQPRDYINSLQLISVLGLLVMGLLAASMWGGAPMNAITPAVDLELAAPAINPDPVGAPAMFPFLFITIACGAISGFHCLVSSGTSSKQLKSEPDARFIGYGAMLTEGFLATLVILACVAGVGLGVYGDDGATLVGSQAWMHHYGEWTSGLGPALGAFVGGSANFLKALGIPGGVAIALMGVFVASFAGTTLDTACRLQRYIVQELANTVAPKTAGVDLLGWLRGKHGATIFAVGVALLLAAIPPAGAEWSMANAGGGGLILWPIFGATNQLLAGLSFVVVTFYLWRRAVPIWFLVVPMILLLILPAWAMTLQAFVGESSWLAQGNWLLVGIAVATLILEAWMVVEAIKLFPRVKGVIETNAIQPVTTG